MIVLLPDPALRGERRRGEDPLQAFERVTVGERSRVDFRFGIGAPPWPPVDRRFGDQRPDRDFAGDLSSAPQHQPPGVGDPADHREVQLPFLEDVASRGLAAWAQDHQHALLAFAQHDFVGRHATLAHRYPVEIELDAEPALARHLDRGRRQPGRPHVLDRDDRVLLHQFEAGLDQQFLGERIPDLDGRPLLSRVTAELGRSHRRAVDAVASGLRADINDEVARPRSRRIEDPVGTGETDAHRIEQNVPVVGGVELALAADRRHADAVAVAANPADDTRH